MPASCSHGEGCGGGPLPLTDKMRLPTSVPSVSRATGQVRALRSASPDSQRQRGHRAALLALAPGPSCLHLPALPNPSEDPDPHDLDKTQVPVRPGQGPHRP